MSQHHVNYKAYVSMIKFAVEEYDKTVYKIYTDFCLSTIRFEEIAALEQKAWERRLEMCDKARQLLVKLPVREDPMVESSSKGIKDVKYHQKCDACDQPDCRYIGCKYR